MFNEVVIRFCENPTYECRQDQILFANLTDRFKLELRFVPVKTRFSITFRCTKLTGPYHTRMKVKGQSGRSCENEQLARATVNLRFLS